MLPPGEKVEVEIGGGEWEAASVSEIQPKFVSQTSTKVLAVSYQIVTASGRIIQDLDRSCLRLPPEPSTRYSTPDIAAPPLAPAVRQHAVAPVEEVLHIIDWKVQDVRVPQQLSMGRMAEVSWRVIGTCATLKSVSAVVPNVEVCFAGGRLSPAAVQRGVNGQYRAGVCPSQHGPLVLEISIKGGPVLWHQEVQVPPLPLPTAARVGTAPPQEVRAIDCTPSIRVPAASLRVQVGATHSSQLKRKPKATRYARA